MRKSLMTGALALALVFSAHTASAQARTRPDGADATARREWLKEHRDAAKKRWEDLTPAQRDAFKDWVKTYEAERKTLMEQVKAGKLDKKSAAEQLKAWRETHKPGT